MSAEPPSSGLQLRSLLHTDGTLELSLVDTPTPIPGPDEVVVRVEAAPINPSDLSLLLAGADVRAATNSGTGAGTMLHAKVASGLERHAARMEQSMRVGNEGGGVVVAAGSAPEAQALLGRTVGCAGGTFAQYTCVKVSECLPVSPPATSRDAASWHTNPMTALALVETMRREGHTAMVHTAAASNLGQMLNRICLADQIPLVCIVRKPEQADLLRSQGASHVLDSNSPSFDAELFEALVDTGATIAFDAIGGGTLGSQILTAMEKATNAGVKEFARFGANRFKQLYIYGGLDRRPTELSRAFGYTWSVGGWLLGPFLDRFGPEAAEAMKARIANEITTTFASHYTAEISLAQALQTDVIRSYARLRTGTKYLINPML